MGLVNGDNTLILHNQTNGRIAYWRINTSGLFVDGGLIRQSELRPPWSIRGVSDIDNDGNVDLVLHNLDNGSISYWMLNNDATFKSGALVRPSSLRPPWDIRSVIQ